MHAPDISFHSVISLWTLCSIQGCQETSFRVSLTTKNHAISSHALIRNSFFLPIQELHFNVCGLLETKYLCHIYFVALRSFFIVILSGSICGGEGFLRMKNFDRGNVLDLIPFCSLLFSFSALRQGRNVHSGAARQKFVYDFVLFYVASITLPSKHQTDHTCK